MDIKGALVGHKKEIITYGEGRIVEVVHTDFGLMVTVIFGDCTMEILRVVGG